MIFRRLFLFLLSMMAVNGLFSQHYLVNIKHLGLKEGLSNLEVQCIHQDRNGLIWIGTKNGLNRYDGFEFKVWTKEKNGLSSNAIHHIEEDKNGMLWLFSGYRRRDKAFIRSIDIFNPLKGKSIKFEQYFRSVNPFLPNEIKDFYSTDSGIIFYAKEQYWLYNLNRKFRLLSFPSGFVIKGITYPAGIWGTVGKKIIESDLDGKTVYETSIIDESLFNVVTGNKHSVFMSFIEKNGKPDSFKYLYKNKLLGCKSISLNAAAFQQFRQNPISNHVWIAYSGNVIIVDSNGIIVQEINKKELKNDRAIRIIFIDKQGLAWLGTESGIIEIELKPQLFTNYLYRKREDSVHYQCRGILENNGELLVATYEGVYKINLKSHQETAKKVNADDINRFPILMTREGKIWSGARKLNEINSETGDETGKSIDIKHRIWTLYEDKKGDIWIGTEANGIYKYINYSGYSNVASNNNSFIGYGAGYSSTGMGNTAIGNYAYFVWSLGYHNTLIGDSADVSSSGLFNATAIGYNARVSSSNSLVLGNGANVGIGKSSPSYSLDVSGMINADSFSIGGLRLLGNKGSFNTMVGVGTGTFSTGSSNSFTGYNAGRNNRTGGANDFM